MIIEGRALVIPGEDVDTDAMYPGQFLNVDDPEQMKQYLFEGFDPGLRERLGADTIVVTGRNFGIGSSREHPVQALKAWGVQAVLGPSFARIFRRNCVNMGLLAIEAPEAAAAAEDGSAVRIDTDTGDVEVDGKLFHAAATAPLVRDLQAAGGLIPWAARRADDRP